MRFVKGFACRLCARYKRYFSLRSVEVNCKTKLVSSIYFSHECEIVCTKTDFDFGARQKLTFLFSLFTLWKERGGGGGGWQGERDLPFARN